LKAVIWFLWPFSFLLFLAFTSCPVKAQILNDTLKTESPKISLGGELRLRLRTFGGINFGDVALPRSEYDTYLNMRGMLHADLRVNNTFDFYSELCSGHTTFKNDLSSSDKDLLGISQLWADISPDNLHFRIRLGRQQFFFGSGKILGSSDNPNVSRNFDGLRSTVYLGGTTGDFMIAGLAENEMGVFDNNVSTKSLMYGSYWSIPLKKEQVLDFYFFVNRLKNEFINGMFAEENRFTAGTRINKAAGPFSYETEFTLQFGDFGSKKILAYHLTSAAGYRWQDAKLKPALKLTGTIYSGKRDSTDQRISFFRPIFSRPPVSSLTPIGSTNIIFLVPEGEITVRERLEFSLRYYAIWRYSANDGLYSPRLESLARMPDLNGEEKGIFIAHGFSAMAGYTINNHLDFSCTAGCFFPGNYILNTGKGKTVKAVFLVARYVF
jgi:hypothetical protein